MRTLLLLILLLSSSLSSLPVGNPGAASLFTNGIYTHGCASPCSYLLPWTTGMHVRTGFYGDFVYERNLMRLYYRNRGGENRVATQNTNALILVANTFDWIEVFGVAGQSQIDLKSRSDVTVTDTILEFQSALSWSFGMRATAARFGNLLIGGEGQYFRTDPVGQSYTNVGSGKVTYINNMNQAHFEEWQVGFGATYLIETYYRTLLAPYLAFNVSNMRGDLRDYSFQDGNQTINLFDLTAEKVWGFAVGCSMILSRQVGLTIEGRFANENALYVTGQITW
jgi:hypothetical protein